MVHRFYIKFSNLAPKCLLEIFKIVKNVFFSLYTLESDSIHTRDGATLIPVRSRVTSSFSGLSSFGVPTQVMLRLIQKKSLNYHPEKILIFSL